MPAMDLRSYLRISAPCASAVMSVTKMRSRSVAPPSPAMKLREAPPIHVPAGSLLRRFSSAASSRIRPCLIMPDTSATECMPVLDISSYFRGWLAQDCGQIVRSDLEVLFEERMNFACTFLNVGAGRISCGFAKDSRHQDLHGEVRPRSGDLTLGNPQPAGIGAGRQHDWVAHLLFNQCPKGGCVVRGVRCHGHRPDALPKPEW